MSEAASKVNPVPPGYEGATPYIAVSDAKAAIRFYEQAFGATELFRIGGKEGEPVGHAEIKIGGAIIMLSDEFPEMLTATPTKLGKSSVGLMIYVPDVDAFHTRAVAGGAKVAKPMADQFYGDRSVSYECPFGHFWTFATHIEDVPPDELERRVAKLYGG